MVILYRNFGTTFPAHFQGTLTKGQICWSETSVTNYNYSLSNNPEERSSEMDQFAARLLIIISDSLLLNIDLPSMNMYCVRDLMYRFQDDVLWSFGTKDFQKL